MSVFDEVLKSDTRRVTVVPSGLRVLVLVPAADTILGAQIGAARPGDTVKTMVLGPTHSDVPPDWVVSWAETVAGKQGGAAFVASLARQPALGSVFQRWEEIEAYRPDAIVFGTGVLAGSAAEIEALRSILPVFMGKFIVGLPWVCFHDSEGAGSIRDWLAARERGEKPSAGAIVAAI